MGGEHPRLGVGGGGVDVGGVRVETKLNHFFFLQMDKVCQPVCLSGNRFSFFLEAWAVFACWFLFLE